MLRIADNLMKSQSLKFLILTSCLKQKKNKQQTTTKKWDGHSRCYYLLLSLLSLLHEGNRHNF